MDSIELFAVLSNLQVMVEAWAEEHGASELVNAPEMIAARALLASEGVRI